MLHWPDSMFTLLAEDGILFSNDAFGQHVANSKRFDKDFDLTYLLREAQKYYANLVTLGSPMLRMKLYELTNTGLINDIKMIAPCHGEIWTNPGPIVEKYAEWGSGVCKDKITIIYDTMHHSTEKLAYQIAEGIMSEDVEVVMYFMQEDNPDDVIDFSGSTITLTRVVKSQEIINEPILFNTVYNLLRIYYPSYISPHTGNMPSNIITDKI